MQRIFRRCVVAAPRLRTAAPRLPFRYIHPSPIVRQEAQAAGEFKEDEKITKFRQLEERGFIHPNIVKNLVGNMKLETLTEVQQKTINQALDGKDIIAQAKTGTGKTLAFLLPILQNIIKIDPDLARANYSFKGPRTTADDIRALVISPTRELAEQIAQEARRAVRGTSIVVQTAVGGTQKARGLQSILREGCHLLVATPGRLKDIMTDNYSQIEMPDLSVLVLDEADRLLDQGFWAEIQEIMQLLPAREEVDRQTLMFSATVPPDVVRVVRRTLKPGFNFVQCVPADEEPTHKRIPQKVINVNGFENMLPTLAELIQRGIDASSEPTGRPFKAIVYFNSTAEVTLADEILNNLSSPGAEGSEHPSRRRHPWKRISILPIHSKLTQSQRTRAAETFKRSKSAILLSSDVTARGMDFPDVTHVIQMGVPQDRESYIHRIGRTGRAGKEGEGWLILPPAEIRESRTRLRGLPIKQDGSFGSATADLVREDVELAPEVGGIVEMLRKAAEGVPYRAKAAVYSAMLGTHSYVSDKEGFMAALNRLATKGWGMGEPPTLSAGIVGRLGLSRVPGVRVGGREDGEKFGKDAFERTGLFQRDSFQRRDRERGFERKDPFQRAGFRERRPFERNGSRGGFRPRYSNKLDGGKNFRDGDTRRGWTKRNKDSPF
ncbi:DEAD-domain-containing protein [Piedraia hortae CBS 480.64]|uniref:ATP-dependent RNA helicase n=1 Tax=Piedraia hortae CBS 480.64 TaxID=1314780 RepID=A0A6A7C9V2_9PEZI|nr:DEAD-domain-containing protein [Piedraia hortae CBS 480.64]